MKNSISSLLCICFFMFTVSIWAQSLVFPESPLELEFVTEDISRFCTALDSLDQTDINPFHSYLIEGSYGLKAFIPNRIINADSLLRKVEQRRGDYEKMKDIETSIRNLEKEIKPYFCALEFWYPYATYPPVYFVIGRFNSGGTVSEGGLIIGVEKVNDFSILPFAIIHESIHFQQTKISGKATLLEQAIIEGSADFIAELVTGILGNQEMYRYGNMNENDLCSEFVQIMNNHDTTDWLYQTSGKDERPRDLGYWIGYKIVKAFFDKSTDKRLAVNHILNINDYKHFLERSGYLSRYINKDK